MFNLPACENLNTRSPCRNSGLSKKQNKRTAKTILIALPGTGLVRTAKNVTPNASQVVFAITMTVVKTITFTATPNPACAAMLICAE
jgi:hypothetical protein